MGNNKVKNIIRLQARKDAAYAWRNMMFYLSYVSFDQQLELVSHMKENLKIV